MNEETIRYHDLMPGSNRGVFSGDPKLRTKLEPEQPETVEADPLALAARIDELQEQNANRSEYLLDALESSDPAKVADALLAGDETGLRLDDYLHRWQDSDFFAAQAWVESRELAATTLGALSEQAEEQAQRAEVDAERDRVTDEFAQSVGISEGTREYQLVKAAVDADPADDSTPELWRAKLDRAAKQAEVILKGEKRAIRAREDRLEFAREIAKGHKQDPSKVDLPPITAADIQARAPLTAEQHRAERAKRNAQMREEMAPHLRRTSVGVFPRGGGKP